MRYVKRIILLSLITLLSLQCYFIFRISLSNIWPIYSTAFQRTAAVELWRTGSLGQWNHAWLDYAQMSESIKRAVIAAEDSRFGIHYGIEIDAIINAWKHNSQTQNTQAGTNTPIRGGSTITQQLAKNLFLSTEQTYWRKGQELFLTFILEAFLSKERLLELYLNHAEWGKGIYGVQAAAQTYFNKNVNSLSIQQSAKLAAMLPRPRYYQEYFNTPYLVERTRKIMVGMPLVQVP